MSRGGASIARSLRNEESQQLRKRILKNKSASVLDSSESEQIFDNLAESNNKYMERIASLSKFTEKSKSTTKTMSHKVIWLREQATLSQSVNQIQSEVADLVGSLVMHSPGDQQVIAMAEEMDSLFLSRDENAKLLMSQWQDVNSMKSELLKSINKYRQQSDSGSTISIKEGDNLGGGITSQTIDGGFDNTRSNTNNNNDDEINNKIISNDNKVAFSDFRSIPESFRKSAAVFADILMKLREGIIYQTMDFHSVENSMLIDILKDRNMICHLVHQDVLTDQNEILLSEFQIKDSDDMATDVFMQDWMSKFPVLDSEFKMKLNELQKERESICYQHVIDVGDINGGWLPEHHDIFIKMYKRASSEGMARKLLLETLLAELPGKTKQEIVDHEDWYRVVRVLNHRKSEISNEYKTKRSSLISQFKEELQKFREQRRIINASDEAYREWEKERDSLHKILEKMRADKAAQLEEELKEMKMLKEIEDTKLQQMQEKIKEDHDMQKKLVEEFKKVKFEALQAKLREEKLEEERRQMEIRKEIELHRENVIERQKKIDEKEQLKRKMALDLEMREMRRIEWLSKLAEQVPYFDAIQNAHSMLDHVTAAVKNQEYIKVDYTRGFLPLNGFTDNRIIKDARFRLASALREMGVIHSEAGRQAIQNFHPRPHLAIHGIL